MKNKNKRYKKNREKSLHQEIQSLQPQTQDKSETEYFKNQNETLLKEEMSAEKLPLSEKKQSNNSYRGYRNNNSDKNTSSYSLSDTGNINQNGSSFQAENRRKKMQKQINKFQKEEKEVYDPLSKDMDNDGVIDRYDVDFRDSKASYRTLEDDEKYDNWQNGKEKNHDEYVRNPKSKNKKYKQYAKERFFNESSKVEKQNKYTRSNFDDKEFTRNKDTKNNLFEDVNNKRKTTDKNSSQKRKGKFENKEKKISKLQQKKQRQEQKLKNKGIDGKSQSAKSAVIATGMAKRYLESGKEDNAGVDAAYKVSDQVENISRKIYYHGKKKNLKRQKKITKLGKSIDKQEKKLFFQKNMEEMKKSVDYQNTSRLRQFFKRRQYKKQIQKKYKYNVKNRIKKSFTEGSKRFGEFVKSRGKKAVFLLLLAVGIFFMLFQAGSMMMNMGTGMVSNTVSTTYLSSEDTLKEVNQEFSSLEQALQEEMDSVEENHPGYDEYIVKGKEKIGHNVHELLSYITSRYGVVENVSEVESELQSLFQNMYTLTYKEEIEIRYKTVTSSYTDADGNEHTESHEEPYEYKKLIVTLEKREMDSIIREVFQSYPDNLSHYEILLASKGNMELIFGSGSDDFSEIINNPDFSNPGLEFNEESVKRIVHEAEKHIGKRYVFGANGPNNFDCSSFVCWTYTHSGIKNMPRTTAWGIYKDYCNPVSPSEAKAGDIIFFKGTYNSGSPISHVGIYVGGGYMIHAGDPIQYARIDTPYWKGHFYGFGRPK
ncbi:NlpC/P60 family protein [Fusobacterium necrophorum]|uniref:C40 family peptidase n=1 Tax=Fusobacterium necrophorum TaxID=859 RepID=UPI0008863052|nr:C40 family peptidase [Fusobacterium necrophorum]SDB02245.1 NlpC/P60 family protein [Fusobacterium necrophorum]SQD08646.1 Probable endopeptidase p60 precursor [Fusobacterium necrophorum subsp. necrophorum]